MRLPGGDVGEPGWLEGLKTSRGVYGHSKVAGERGPDDRGSRIRINLETLIMTQQLVEAESPGN